MAPENLKDLSAFITFRDLDKSQQAIREEVQRIDDKVDAVDEKVDNLRDMVLPLLESSKQTAENTRKIAESMDKFTEEQRRTNGKMYERLNGHDVQLTDLKHMAGGVAEKKKANATVIVAVLGVVGTIIGGLFALAPVFFQ